MLRVGGTCGWTADRVRAREHAGPERVFTDKASGRDTARPQLAELLQFARDGDTVLVHSMDRLARNLDDLRALVQRLTRNGARVEIVKSTCTSSGRTPHGQPHALRHGAFAVFERSLIRERQREGIAQAKQRGANKGRKKTPAPERAAELVRRAGSGVPKAVLPVTTGSAGRPSTKTCATPSWDESLPCLRP
jgi:DNA invertase Pin-like site-specific DNA recombinase